MADEFSVSVEQWVRIARERADEAFQAIALEALDRVKELTPVRTGFLRAGWHVRVQEANADTLETLGTVSTVAGVLAIVPGPVGRAAAAVSAASSLAQAAIYATDTHEGSGGKAILAAAQAILPAAGKALGAVGAARKASAALAAGKAADVGVAGEAGYELLGYGGPESDDEAIRGARIGDVITIYNNVEYAAPVEYGRSGTRKDGSSYHVEGRGMMAQTVAELPAIAGRVVARYS